MRSALLAIVMLGPSYGCMARVPRDGGLPVAPPSPDRPWQPPPRARVRDSLGRSPELPSDFAGRASALTLSDVIEIALRNDPATRVSWAQALASADAYGASRSSYFPSVSGAVIASRALSASSASGGSASAVGSDSTNSSTTGLGAGGSTGARTTYGSSLSLSYLVFDFGARNGIVEEARETAFATAYTHNRVVQTTVLQVEQAFFQYAGTQAIRDAQRTSVAEAQTSYNAALKRDSVGLATIADVLQARTALAQTQLQLQTSEAQWHAARSTLSLALGIPPTASYDITANPGDVPVKALATCVDSLIDRGVRDRPDLQSAYASAASARAAIRAARSAMLPSLSLSAQDGYQRSSLAPLAGHSYSFSLAVQVPFFNGEANAYDLRRARALADVSAALAESTRQIVIADVYAAYYNLEMATQQVATSDDLFASASAAMRAARARYTQGLTQIVDLLSAQAALASARAQQAQARWSWAQYLANLGYAAGATPVIR